MAGEHYQIEQQVESAELPEIALAVQRAHLTADTLSLTVAFRNQTDEALRFSFITAVETERIRLIDSSGSPHVASAADQQWRAVQPAGGFVPGGANLGTVTFARPIGPGPYQLLGIFDYPALEFDLRQPIAAPPLSAVPAGTYLVESTLFSTESVLEPLRLAVRAVTIEQETVRFTIAFTNSGYRQYGLRRGPTGSDASLLDADRRQYSPLAVSASLRDNITPPEGIAPGAAYTGTVTFPRPAVIDELTFLFAQYSPLRLQFGADGLVDSQLASSSAGTPPTQPTPQPDIALYQQLSALLDSQTTSLRTNQIDQFRSGIAATAQVTLTAPFSQLATMPLATLQMTLAPTDTLPTNNPQQLTALPVTVRYTFAGVPGDNVFIHDFAANFTQQPTTDDGMAERQWQLTTLSPQNNTPFWWNGTVSTYETPHFLIFTRPGTATALETLAQEVETAYALVREQGLPLEERYIAFFTSPEENFAAYTGATNPDILGVALSRYQIDAEAIDVVSRAFYINGSNFVDEDQVEQRQSTITHELVHLALAETARPFTPPWLAEGLAVYYADQDTAADRSVRYNAERLPTIDLTQLTSLSSLGIHDGAGETTSYRYLYSGAVIAYLVERYGEEQVLAFYRGYAAVPAAEVQDRLPLYVNPLEQDRVFQSLSSEVTETALVNHFDLTLAELDAAVKEWLLGQE